MSRLNDYRSIRWTCPCRERFDVKLLSEDILDTFDEELRLKKARILDSAEATAHAEASA